MGFKTKIGLILGEAKTVEEEEKKKMKERSSSKAKKVWNFGFLYRTMNSCMNFHTNA